MTLTLIDIPRLLNIVKIYQNKNQSLRSYVQKTFNDEPISQAKLPNYYEIENFCSDLGLLIVETNLIALTDLGEQLLSQYQVTNKIDQNFKDCFVKECIIPSNIGKRLLGVLKNFHVEESKRWHPKDEVYDLFENPEILPILYETEILIKKHARVEANPEYIQLKIEKKLTQEQLEKQLQNWKETGKIAEQIVVEFEKNRLRDKGHQDQADKVRQISQEHANAGYDIESFHYNPISGIQKIYIEVKGTTEKEFDFFWSANELEKAKELREKYWLYFVSEIDTNTKKSPNKPFMIQNPAEKIFTDSSYKIEIEKYHITKRNLNGL